MDWEGTSIVGRSMASTHCTERVCVFSFKTSLVGLVTFLWRDFIISNGEMGFLCEDEKVEGTARVVIRLSGDQKARDTRRSLYSSSSYPKRSSRRMLEGYTQAVETIVMDKKRVPKR